MSGGNVKIEIFTKSECKSSKLPSESSNDTDPSLLMCGSVFIVLLVLLFISWMTIATGILCLILGKYFLGFQESKQSEETHSSPQETFQKNFETTNKGSLLDLLVTTVETNSTVESGRSQSSKSSLERADTVSIANIMLNPITPDDLALFRNLRKLSIVKCGIKEFYSEKNTLTNIEDLDLSRNELDFVAFENFPTLKTLKVDYNSIKQIPIDCFKGLMNLEEISFANNKINILNAWEKQFADLKSLKKLNLSNNCISYLPLMDLTSSTSSAAISNLEELDLGTNLLSEIHEKTFVGFHSLKKLCLKENCLESENDGLKWLQNLYTLEDLDLSDNVITNIGIGDLRTCQNLKKLEIGCNLLEDKKIKLLNKLLPDVCVESKKPSGRSVLVDDYDEEKLKGLREKYKDIKRDDDKRRRELFHDMKNAIATSYLQGSTKTISKLCRLLKYEWNMIRKGFSLKDILDEFDEQFPSMKRVREFLELQGNYCADHIARGQTPRAINYILVGQPGTGKSSIARYLPKILYQYGIIDFPDKIVETSSELQGAAVGEAAKNVKKAFELASGGVLFIDEAYALLGSKFGAQVIDQMVYCMTSNCKTVVILAGYEKEMEEFLQSNSGLSRRFQQKIDFNYYKAEELLGIARKQFEKKNYEWNDSIKTELQSIFDKVAGDPLFGNADGVIKLLESAYELKCNDRKDLPHLDSNLKGTLDKSYIWKAFENRKSRLSNEDIIEILKICGMSSYANKFSKFKLDSFCNLTESQLKDELKIVDISDRNTILKIATGFRCVKQDSTREILKILMRYKYISVDDTIKIILKEYPADCIKNIVDDLEKKKKIKRYKDLFSLTEEDFIIGNDQTKICIKQEQEIGEDIIYELLRDLEELKELKKVGFESNLFGPSDMKSIQKYLQKGLDDIEQEQKRNDILRKNCKEFIENAKQMIGKYVFHYRVQMNQEKNLIVKKISSYEKENSTEGKFADFEEAMNYIQQGLSIDFNEFKPDDVEKRKNFRLTIISLDFSSYDGKLEFIDIKYPNVFIKGIGGTTKLNNVYLYHQFAPFGVIDVEVKVYKEFVCPDIRNYVNNDKNQKEKEFVLDAVKQNGNMLQYASDDLRDDNDVVETALKENTSVLKYALKSSTKHIVSKNGYALQYASDEYKNDKEVVLAAVKQYGYALKYASDELKNDKEVVLAAVKQNGYALQFASNELKNDKDVLAARSFL